MASKEEEGVETRKVSKEEAAFILGQGGKTKAKLCAVSSAQIDLQETRGPSGLSHSQLQIRGTPRQRRCARKYIEFVIAQRVGPVNVKDPSEHDDLTILVVPADTVSFVTGRQGSFLRLVEEEWSALLFFLQVNPKNPPIHVDPTRTERLAIFGPQRRRRGAELKVMAAIEMKLPGHFTNKVTAKESPDMGFATDTVAIKEEDYSYALGRSGATRKKLARASGCIVEYVGRMAFLSGSKQERKLSKEYLRWLLLQRIGETVHVDSKGRDDVTVIMVPSNGVRYVAGSRVSGLGLRSIEEETSTFCIIDGTSEESDDHKPLLIFGCQEDRRVAESLVCERILSQKADEAVSSSHGADKGKRAKGGNFDKDWKDKDWKDKDWKDKEWKGKEWKDQDWKDKDWSWKDKDWKDKEWRDTDWKDKDWKGWDSYGKDRDRTVAAPTLPAGNAWAPCEAGDEGDGPDPEHVAREGCTTESLNIISDDAAFLMGPKGGTKKKIAAVSGAYLELKTSRLEVTGTAEERERAKKYIGLVMAQRVGPVKIEAIDQHTDLSVVEVPAEAVSFVTGKQGSFLRLVEEEFGTLLFFIDFSRHARREQQQLERLAIFGARRDRRGAELKVMAAIEMKQPGCFTKRDPASPMQDPMEGFATDRMHIHEEDYSYALGKGGATRKKIAQASGCVIEYIGRLAFLSGTKKERTHAREYLGWLFLQRVGSVEVNYQGRDDVTVLPVPKDCVGFVTGHKGTSLRAVEDASGTFCFIEGGREDPYRDPKPLLIFGDPDARATAEELLQKRINLKLVGGWVDEDGTSLGNSCHHGEKSGGRHGRDKGQRKGGGRGQEKTSGGTIASDEHGGQAAAGSELPQDRSAGRDRGEDSALREPDGGRPPNIVEGDATDFDGLWGDWGGSSDEEAQAELAAGAGATASAGSGDISAAVQVPSTANMPSNVSVATSVRPGVPVLPPDPRTAAAAQTPAGSPSKAAAAQTPSGSAGWGRGSPHPASGSAGNIPSPHRSSAAVTGSGGSGGAGTGGSPAKASEEIALPPHLLHEEAWPDLGLGAPKAAPKAGPRKARR